MALVSVAALAVAASPLAALLLPGAAGALAPPLVAASPTDCVGVSEPAEEPPPSQPHHSTRSSTQPTGSIEVAAAARASTPSSETSTPPSEPNDPAHCADDRSASEPPASTADLAAHGAPGRSEAAVPSEPPGVAAPAATEAGAATAASTATDLVVTEPAATAARDPGGDTVGDRPAPDSDNTPMPAAGGSVRAVVRVAAVLFALGGIAAFVAAGSPRPTRSTPPRPNP